jgi:uncharacterized protein (TIGR02246 family)
MSRSLSLVLVAAALAASAGCPRGAAPERPGAEAPREVVDAVRGTIEQWRQAYEIRSLDVLGQLYTRDLDLVVVQEGTAWLGWSSVEAMLKDRLARTSRIHVRLKDVQVVALGDDAASAVATMTRERSDATTTVTETGTLTVVLRRVDDRWLIAAEHYSYRRAP